MLTKAAYPLSCHGNWGEEPGKSDAKGEGLSRENERRKHWRDRGRGTRTDDNIVNVARPTQVKTRFFRRGTKINSDINAPTGDS